MRLRHAVLLGVLAFVVGTLFRLYGVFQIGFFRMFGTMGIGIIGLYAVSLVARAQVEAGRGELRRALNECGLEPLELAAPTQFGTRREAMAGAPGKVAVIASLGVAQHGQRGALRRLAQAVEDAAAWRGEVEAAFAEDGIDVDSAAALVLLRRAAGQAEKRIGSAAGVSVLNPEELAGWLQDGGFAAADGREGREHEAALYDSRSEPDALAP